MKKILRVSGIAALMLMLGAAVGTAQQISIDNAVQNSAWGLSTGISSGARVVVLSVESASFAMSDFLVNEMTAALTGLQTVQGFTVVPNSEVNQAIMGLPISASSSTTNAMAQSVGRLLNAHFVVIGTFEPIAGFFRFRVQLVEVHTANVRSVHTVDVQNDAIVAHFMGGALWAGGMGPPLLNWFSWGQYGRGSNLRYERSRVSNSALGVNVFYAYSDFFFTGGSGTRLANTLGFTMTSRLFPGGGPFYFELGYGLGWMQRWRVVEWEWESQNNFGFMLNPAIGFKLGGRRWAGQNWGWFLDITAALPVVIGLRGFTARFHPGAALGIAW